MPLKRHFSI